MNIENLRSFLEVTATGSFQKASENLHITQSSVSARIKALEERLNRELFMRKRDGVILSNGGKAFYPFALSVVKTWQQAQQEVALPEGVAGIVSLGIPVHYWSKIYADWLAWMNRYTPGIATRIQSDYSVYLLQELLQGLLDLALVFEPLPSSELHQEAIFKEPLILVATEPREVSEKQAPGYIYVDWGREFQQQHNNKYPDVPHHRITVALENQALEQMFNAGGSAYLACSTAQPLIEKGQLFAVTSAPEFLLTIYLAITKSRRHDPCVERAVEGLRATPFIQNHAIVNNKITGEQYLMTSNQHKMKVI